jgi:hypothetical protein
MKNVKISFNNTTFLLVLIMFAFNSCQEKFDYRIIQGKWVGANSTDSVSFYFFENGNCLLELANDSSNSRITLNGNYEIDPSKKPIPISIKNIQQLSHPLHTIIEFVSSDSINLAKFSPRWRLRPISFDKKTMMSLKRVSIVDSILHEN